MKGVDAYLLWNRGGPLRDGAGNTVLFTTIEEIESFVAAAGWTVETTRLHHHDLDIVGAWVSKTGEDASDCDMLLDAWNLLTCMMATLECAPVNFEDRKYRALYKKLYWGSSQPAEIAGRPAFEPTFSDMELRTLRSVLGVGLHMFRGIVQPPLKTSAVEAASSAAAA